DRGLVSAACRGLCGGRRCFWAVQPAAALARGLRDNLRPDDLGDGRRHPAPCLSPAGGGLRCVGRTLCHGCSGGVGGAGHSACGPSARDQTPLAALAGNRRRRSADNLVLDLVLSRRRPAAPMAQATDLGLTFALCPSRRTLHPLGTLSRHAAT